MRTVPFFRGDNVADEGKILDGADVSCQNGSKNDGKRGIFHTADFNITVKRTTSADLDLIHAPVPFDRFDSVENFFHRLWKNDDGSL